MPTGRNVMPPFRSPPLRVNDMRTAQALQ